MQMTNAAFGEVLAEVLADRGVPVTRAAVEGLAEGTTINAEQLIGRMESPFAPHPDGMEELADKLELSDREKRRIAYAFTFDEVLEETPEVPELSPEQERVLMSRIRSLDAINTAIATVEDNPSPNPRVQEETLDELRMLSEEARSRVMGLKRQYGFKDY